ncbi:nucleotidyltransferase domain-containing protein [Mesorhizobium sp. BAC0120]|uniref:nucleotidyltransferase family protein n=1 Tax=Mesorhizobium sp. BAC0120 TaxID=3090670 RepID=UPI00298D1D7B|nr:nucleotidyltransferase domain-containing protein [Mesorhizobium sp. BAC0120]MDW6024124.1 nucleotidyltransferase domain-containing protein [Mesorhizobium sp. BAC0120]
MKRDEVIRRLKSTEPALRSRGIAALFLFGSHARDAAKPTSDIDVFVDPDRDKMFGFDEFMDSYETLKAALPDQQIGFSTREGIDRHVRPYVEREAVRVF